MSRFTSHLRVFWQVLLCLFEIVLVALFSVAVATRAPEADEVGCLILHSATNIILWAHEAYVALCKSRNTGEITHVAMSSVVFVMTSLSFSIYCYRLAQNPGPLEFGNLGSPGAYTVLVISWLSILLAIQWLIYSCIDKHRASVAARTQPKLRKFRSSKIDWSQRPLPVKILHVRQGSGDSTIMATMWDKPIKPVKELQWKPEAYGQIQPPTPVAHSNKYNDWPEIKV